LRDLGKLPSAQHLTLGAGEGDVLGFANGESA